MVGDRCGQTDGRMAERTYTWHTKMTRYLRENQGDETKLALAMCDGQFSILFQDSFLSYFLDSFLSLFLDSFPSFYFRIVFYPIFGLNSILFSDSFKKMPKIQKKDRIQSKNGIENYPKIKRWKTIRKKGQKTIRKIGQKTILKRGQKSIHRTWPGLKVNVELFLQYSKFKN